MSAPAPVMVATLLDDLAWRGLLYQHTEGVAEALRAGQVTGYIGFDPTAPSLHVGSLLQVMSLLRLQRSGHRPIALVGGGTGMIGDPSGKGSERALQTPEVVAANTAGIREQLERFLDFGGPNAALMVDNAEWLVPLRAVDFMRDVGKHFTVNYMLQKESVKGRMEAGISYTEFSYMLLQAYDFLELSRRYGVTLQMGGSDQWGNITAGAELIRRTTGADAHAITVPLVTTSAGTKFGKTEGGAVWLDASLTSPYKFFQFWINVDDQDALRYLRYFTLMSREEIEALDAATEAHPERREAQLRLAAEVTARVHGDYALRAAEEASRVLFGGADPRTLSEATFDVLREEIPTFALSRETGEVTSQDVLHAVTDAKTGLFKSRGDAKRMVEQGGVYVNGERLGGEPTPVDLLAGRYVLVRKGGKSYGLVDSGAPTAS
jgi:tyrosyl-tRNA synthetase